MCLSKVYGEKNGDRALLMEEIASVKIGENGLLFKTLFGEQKEVKADIREIDFLTHSIYLENVKESSIAS